MKNRERLLKTNEYDLLCRIQRNMVQMILSCELPCVLTAIDGQKRECHDRCEDCIQTWMNEEAGK